MGYEKTVEFSGVPEKVIEIAQSMFVQSGYRIISVSDTSISAKHEGGFVRSMSGNAIYGTSPVTVTVEDKHININADYEGVDKVKKFLLQLFLGLAFFLGIFFGVLFGFIFEEKWPMMLGIGLGLGIPLIQLPIHMVFTPGIMKKRASKALDTFIQNITILAR